MTTRKSHLVQSAHAARLRAMEHLASLHPQHFKALYTEELDQQRIRLMRERRAARSAELQSATS